MQIKRIGGKKKRLTIRITINIIALIILGVGGYFVKKNFFSPYDESTNPVTKHLENNTKGANNNEQGKVNSENKTNQVNTEPSTPAILEPETNNSINIENNNQPINTGTNIDATTVETPIENTEIEMITTEENNNPVLDEEMNSMRPNMEEENIVIPGEYTKITDVESKTEWVYESLKKPLDNEEMEMFFYQFTKDLNDSKDDPTKMNKYILPNYGLYIKYATGKENQVYYFDTFNGFIKELGYSWFGLYWYKESTNPLIKCDEIQYMRLTNFTGTPPRYCQYVNNKSDNRFIRTVLTEGYTAPEGTYIHWDHLRKTERSISHVIFESAMFFFHKENGTYYLVAIDIYK